MNPTSNAAIKSSNNPIQSGLLKWNTIRKLIKPTILLRLLGICFFGCLTGFLWFNSPYWMAGIWTAAITAALFANTVKYMNEAQRKLTSFLQSLSQNDFSVTFSENAKSDDYHLHRAFNQLNETYVRLRSEKQEQHDLLQILVEDAGVPIICFDESDGNIYLTNQALKSLMNLPYIRNVDSLRKVDRTLPDQLRNIRDGEKETLKLTINNTVLFLAITSRHIIFKDKSLKLLVLADVTRELAAKEAETWQKLLRVLTHEISNSAIPLSTLSAYMHEVVTGAEKENRTLSPSERQDLLESLRTIEQRSTSLKAFVQNFKSLNQIPDPKPGKVLLKGLLEEVFTLFATELKAQGITLIIPQEQNLHDVFIFCDRILTAQVLINIFKNAIESMNNLKDRKVIEVKIGIEAKKYLQLHLRDSGCGIMPEDLEQIFIPFYSTKKGGSGIGLSISRQIMQKQRGDISVTSAPGNGSAFTLAFALAE